MPDASREELWQERRGQWRESRLSQRTFALQHGCAKHRVGYWVRRPGAQAAWPDVLPVSVKQAPPPASALSLGGPGSWTVALPARLPASWFAEMLRGL